MTNSWIDLSRGVIDCRVRSDRPFPAAAYTELRTIAEAIDRLHALMAATEPEPAIYETVEAEPDPIEAPI